MGLRNAHSKPYSLHPKEAECARFNERWFAPEARKAFQICGKMRLIGTKDFLFLLGA